MGRIDAWNELSLLGIWDELSLGTNRRLGRIVALRGERIIDRFAKILFIEKR